MPRVLVVQRASTPCEELDDTETAGLSAAADSEVGFVSEVEQEAAGPPEDSLAEGDDVNVDVCGLGIRLIHCDSEEAL